MKLDPVLTTDMIKFAGLDPTGRRNYLEKVLKNPSLGDYNSDPAVKVGELTKSCQEAIEDVGFWVSGCLSWILLF